MRIPAIKIMTVVSRRNMAAEKARFIISVGGIALAVFLMSFLLSLYQGWRLNVGRFVDRVSADVWVAREGTPDFLAAASILPADLGDQLAAVPGVAGVDPLIVDSCELGTPFRCVPQSLLCISVQGFKVLQRTEIVLAEPAKLVLEIAVLVGRLQLRVIG